ncbi:uncharacterized protein LOC143888948 [Tasmannia lanceolata]|uniref:uncharacterized protein LOC143859709 n=1 Tax=Tasmannia lanceolata TaxID=3420 RepID=UPI004063607D
MEDTSPNKIAAPLPPLLPDPKSNPSWANLLSASPIPPPQTESNLPFFSPIISEKGEKKAIFKESDYVEAKDKWKHCLLGFFLGRRPFFSTLKQHLQRKWKLKGNFLISSLPKNFILFKFSLEEDFLKVLEAPITTYGGRPLILQKWSPECSLEKRKLSSIPIWIRFPELHLKFWTPSGLGKLASTIGHPLFMDSITAEGTHLNFARVCVEVTPEDELLDSIEIETPSGTFFQVVEYNWKPKACITCRDFSHSADRCPLIPLPIPKSKQEWIKIASKSVENSLPVPLNFKNLPETHASHPQPQISTQNGFSILDSLDSEIPVETRCGPRSRG